MSHTVAVSGSQLFLVPSILLLAAYFASHGARGLLQVPALPRPVELAVPDHDRVP